MIIFEPGDRMPEFGLADVLGNTVHFALSVVGQPFVLFACEEAPEKHLATLADAAARFEDATVLCLTRQSVDENRQLAEKLRLPFPLLSDPPGQVVTALSTAPGKGARNPPLATYTLDTNQRIRRVDRGRNAKIQIDKALRCLESMRPSDPAPTPRPAPLLHVPKVLNGEMCRELIRIWERKGNQRTGTIDVMSNEIESFSDDVKIRRDHYVRDKELLARLSNVVGRRVAPEIDKAFCFQASRVEEFKIVCYDAESEGFFRPHKDNLSDRTAHRKFAMSLLLNDPSEYEGGELRYLEYGPELYRPGAGDAVIFSCSLLHEVLPVTSGQRFVLLCFLYGEAEAHQLDARRRQGR